MLIIAGREYPLSNFSVLLACFEPKQRISFLDSLQLLTLAKGGVPFG